MGAAGRTFVEQWASPAAVAARYEALFEELIAHPETPNSGSPWPQ